MAIGRIPEPGTGIPESIIAAKGDLLTGTANDTPAVLTVGANGTTLVADSATATGLKWQATSTSGLTLLNKTTLSSTTNVSLNNVFSATYDNYLIQYTGSFVASNTDVKIRLRASGTDDATGIYYYGINATDTNGTVSSSGGNAQTSWLMTTDNTVVGGFTMNLYRPFATVKTCYSSQFMRRPNDRGGYNNGFFDDTTSFDGFSLFFANACVGTLAVYGYGI
jgi:hypothetical protein